MKRGLMDRLTNRDTVREQKTHIDILRRQVKEKDELVLVQADAIDEFKEQVIKLTDEVSDLWESVNSMAKMRREKVESENN